MRHTLLLRRPDHVVQALVLLLTGLLFLTAGCGGHKVKCSGHGPVRSPSIKSYRCPLQLGNWSAADCKASCPTVGTRFPHITENHIWQTSGTGIGRAAFRRRVVADGGRG